MSAVVSVMITKITIVIDTIAPTWKVGLPKWNSCGSAITLASPTWEKSALPTSAANSVPTTMPMRMDSLEIAPWNTRLITRMMSSVSAAKPMLDVEPRSLAPAPPMAQVNATGSRDSPITVMIDPVTTAGKSRTSWAKNELATRPISPATMIAPNTGRTPPSLAMATIVETLANEMPCTMGSRLPNGPMPRVCNSVARPLMNRPAVTSSAMSPGESLAAPPTISGGAMTPPYIVRMCWVP
jgi:hypothetical protein